jgi:stage II sporulation protein D (peptidoglycan lytic transglycosylase)
MRRGAQICSLLIALAGLRASAQEFRVELLSASVVRQATIEAESREVKLCPALAKRSCWVVPRGGSGICRAASSGVRCETSSRGDPALRLPAQGGERSRPAGRPHWFRTVEITSGAEFRLKAEATRNNKAEDERWFSLREVRLSSSAGGVQLVATVDLETYVAAVLAGEAGTMRSPAALRAMAVVARTWALGARGRHAKEGFDFCSLTHCQVLRLPAGKTAGRSTLWSSAAKETEGETLQFRGRLAEVYFSAACGGQTEAAADLWPDRAAPYLVSLSDPFCGSSEHASWERRISLPSAARILEGEMGVQLGGPLVDLKVESRDASGRAKTLVAVGLTSQQVNANDFRYAMNRKLGWDVLLSNLYRIEPRPGVLIFRGRGLGHGVGLCQAGAEEMAYLGADYRKILNRYFPGTEVRPLSPASDPILSSEHFELVFPANQQPWAGETLAVLERERAWLDSIGRELPSKVRVETWESTEEFIRATGQPGWVAAATDGHSISLQPLKKLHDRGILASALRHELAHLGVRQRRAPGVPQWFEEGFVLFLTGEQPPPSSQPANVRSLEQRIEKPHSEAEMKAAYAEALARVKRLGKEKGHEGLWRMLEHPSAEDLAWFKNHE